MFFDNLTGDQNLQWLQKGLAEMFIRALSQSRYLSILSTDRLIEILNRVSNEHAIENSNLKLASLVAREANVEAILVGNISKDGDLLKINVQLKEPFQGRVLKEESIKGRGMEKILQMVDDLSQKIRQDLQVTLDQAEPGKSLSEITTNSLEAWRHYTNGIDFVNKFLIRDAIEQFQKAVELDSMFLSAYLRLWGLTLNEKMVVETDQVYQKVLSLKDRATKQEQFEIELIQARRKDDIKKLFELHKNRLRDYPDDRDANYAMAILYYGINNHAKAIDYLKKTIEIDPKHKLATNQLGYEYALTGDFKQAIQTLKRYRQLVPDEPNPYDSIGEIYSWMGDFKTAEKYFKKAIEINDQFVVAREHLSEIYLDQGAYEKGLKVMFKFLETSPEGIVKIKTYNNIAFTFWRLGKIDQAIHYFKKSLDENVFQYWATKQLQLLYAEKGDTSKAKDVLENAYRTIQQQLDSEELIKQYYSVLTQFSLNDTLYIDDTIQLCKQVVEKVDNPVSELRCRFFLSLLYIKSKRYKELEQLWKSSDPLALINLYKDVRSIGFYNLWKYYDLFNEYYYQNIERGIQYYNQMIKLSQESAARQFEVGFRMLLSDLYRYSGDEANSGYQLKMTGMPAEEKWLVIGPFDNKNGFNKKFPPEKQIKLEKEYFQKGQHISWQHADDGVTDGFIYLSKIFNDTKWTVGYGLIYVYSPHARKAQIRLGTDEGAKLWFNDTEIWRINHRRIAVIGDNIIHIDLKKGLNKVLIKVCNRSGDSGFYFRVTNQKGDGFPDIYFIAADQIVAS